MISKKYIRVNLFCALIVAVVALCLYFENKPLWNVIGTAQIGYAEIM